jgi:5-enolpyruvylshikimate-3-phosphate synthase
MGPNEIGLQWHKLCEEADAAQSAYFRAFAAINEKFSAIGRGTPTANPTDAELTEFEKTRHAWQDVIRRMGEFVKRYAESSRHGVGWPAELGR